MAAISIFDGTNERQEQGVSEIRNATTASQRNVMRPIDLWQTGDSHLIVATLIATVAFTAGFTMPGGYNSNDGPNQGMVILTREAAFKAFMVTDAMAVSFSFSAVLIHFHVAMTKNRDEVRKLVGIAAYLVICAAYAMVLAFVTGTYAVLAHSSGLAISVCVIGCLSLLVFGSIGTTEKVLHLAGGAPRAVLSYSNSFANAIRSCARSQPRGGTEETEENTEV